MKLAEIKVSYSTTLGDSIKIENSKQIYSIALAQWDSDIIEFQEEARMILLNTNNSILGIYYLSKGGLATTTLDIKIVLSIALKCNASGIILLHNHPSGNLSPSQCDLRITQRIKLGCELLGLKLLDHLIISRKGYFSFADDGLL